MTRTLALATLLALHSGVCTPVQAGSQPLRLATTTSTENSGLLAYLLPEFERAHDVEVHVIAVGSGKAIKLGQNGDIDAILSHAPPLEERFIAEGWGVDRRPVMYNDFVIVGPASDRAGIRSVRTARQAFAAISSSGVDFISRGDLSGTHIKEQALWKSAGVEPSGPWYVSAGLGMGRVLLMASERRGYTLTDRGTFLSYRGKIELEILFQGDPPLHNPYTIMAVNPARHEHVNYRMARALIDWISAPEAQELIRSYRVDGQPLFFCNARSAEVRETAQ